MSVIRIFIYLTPIYSRFEVSGRETDFCKNNLNNSYDIWDLV